MDNSVSDSLTVTDLREFEAPIPMEKVLMACSQLQLGEVYTAHLPRVPIMLFPHLEARGLHWQVREEADHSAIITIRKLP